MEKTRRGNYDSGEDSCSNTESCASPSTSATSPSAASRRRSSSASSADALARTSSRTWSTWRSTATSRSGLGAGRTRQRLLARTGRPGRALARALAAPPGVPRRLAGPAVNEGELTFAFVEDTGSFVYVAARPRRRADRARPRALLGPGRLPPLDTLSPHPSGALSPRPEWRANSDRLGTILAYEQLRLEVPLGMCSSARQPPGVGERRVECDDGALAAEWLAGGGDHRQRAAARRACELCRKRLARAVAPCSPSRPSIPTIRGRRARPSAWRSRSPARSPVPEAQPRRQS